jgi:hypothetical protein
MLELFSRSRSHRFSQWSVGEACGGAIINISFAAIALNELTTNPGLVTSVGALTHGRAVASYSDSI